MIWSSFDLLFRGRRSAVSTLLTLN